MERAEIAALVVSRFGPELLDCSEMGPLLRQYHVRADYCGIEYVVTCYKKKEYVVTLCFSLCLDALLKNDFMDFYT